MIKAAISNIFLCFQYITTIRNIFGCKKGYIPTPIFSNISLWSSAAFYCYDFCKIANSPTHRNWSELRIYEPGVFERLEIHKPQFEKCFCLLFQIGIDAAVKFDFIVQRTQNRCNSLLLGQRRQIYFKILQNGLLYTLATGGTDHRLDSNIAEPRIGDEIIYEFAIGYALDISEYDIFCRAEPHFSVIKNGNISRFPVFQTRSDPSHQRIAVPKFTAARICR